MYQYSEIYLLATLSEGGGRMWPIARLYLISLQHSCVEGLWQCASLMWPFLISGRLCVNHYY